MSDMEHQEKLARVIDPDAWRLHDNKDMKGRTKVQGFLVEESMEMAERIIESGLMSDLEWDRREYLRAKDSIKRTTSLSGRCESVEDMMDGYFKHTPACTYWPDGAIGGSGCVR